MVSELGYTDPLTPPPVVTALEGTTHLFQLHFSTESTNQKADYILDTVMETGPHLRPPDEPNVAAEPAMTHEETQTLLLTGPEAETQPIMPLEEPILSAVAVTETPQTPTSPAAEYTRPMHEEATKAEATRASARRQLLMDDIQDQPNTSTKKAKKEE